MRRQRTDTATITVEEDTVIAVVADSHSRPHPRAHEHIASRKPSAIFHAGDIGNHAVLDELEEIAPVYSVRGNIDELSERTPDHLIIDLLGQNESRQLRILLTHIAVHGPKLRKDARLRASEHDAQLVLCGHSHVPLITQEGRITVFNPGSFGPRRFRLPITFGLLDFTEGRIALQHIDCETNAPWLPPGS